MSTHETVVRDSHIEPGSDRSFGLIVGGILGGIGVYQLVRGGAYWAWLLVPGAVLAALGLLAPRVLHPLNIAWTKLGVLLGRIVTPVVMFVVYVVSVVPIGLVLKLAGKDLLSLKRDVARPSYWIERNPPGPTPESLKDQF